MAPTFLLPEQTVRENGNGPSICIEGHESPLSITLGITRVLEQQSIEVSLWGSADGETWSERPLLTFPQKFYCGVYALLLDTSQYPDVKYLRASWKVNRWGRGEPTPLFSIYLFAEEAMVPATRAAVA